MNQHIVSLILLLVRVRSTIILQSGESISFGVDVDPDDDSIEIFSDITFSDPIDQPKGEYYGMLSLQGSDGNVVVYVTQDNIPGGSHSVLVPLWSSATNRLDIENLDPRLILRDGDLQVTYVAAQNGNVRGIAWTAGTTSAVRLRLKSDCNLVLEDSLGNPVWWSGTQGCTKSTRYGDGFLLSSTPTFAPILSFSPTESPLTQSPTESPTILTRPPEKCADESGVCECVGYVTYGVGDDLVERKDVVGSIVCNNIVFGDPAPNQKKACFCSECTSYEDWHIANYNATYGCAWIAKQVEKQSMGVCAAYASDDGIFASEACCACALVPPTTTPTTTASSRVPTLSPTFMPSRLPTLSPTFKPSRMPTPSPTFTSLNMNVEVALEGLSLDNFSPRFRPWFIAQDVIFLTMYAALSIRLALSSVRTYRRVGFTGKGFIAECVLVGCVVRIIYIALVDLASELPISLAYSLRAINDVAWFASFAYLVLFWVELLRTFRQNTKFVVEMRPYFIAATGVFSALRIVRCICEIVASKAGFTIFKAACIIYVGGWVIFGAFWGRRMFKTLARNQGGDEIFKKNKRHKTFRFLTTTVPKSVQKGLRVFTMFIKIEVALTVVLLVEYLVTTILKATDTISIGRTPVAIFGLKVVVRLTEFLIMAALVFLVLLRSTAARQQNKKEDTEVWYYFPTLLHMLAGLRRRRRKGSEHEFEDCGIQLVEVETLKKAQEESTDSRTSLEYDQSILEMATSSFSLQLAKISPPENSAEEGAEKDRDLSTIDAEAVVEEDGAESESSVEESRTSTDEADDEESNSPPTSFYISPKTSPPPSPPPAPKSNPVVPGRRSRLCWRNEIIRAQRPCVPPLVSSISVLVVNVRPTL